MVRRLLIPALLLGAATPALAQRTTVNAVTASDDAFGRAVGSERIGIYSPEDVRGFNPVEAGNARIEGLYFDQQTIVNNRLVDSSAIRVGYAAAAFPFPSPTGIVDMALEKFEGNRVFSGEFEFDPEGNRNLTLQAKIPLDGKRLGLSLGYGARHSRIPATRYLDFRGEAAVLTWRPSAGAEANLFWSHIRGDNSGGNPVYYPAGDYTPPPIERRDYIGQDWAHGEFDSNTLGMTFKYPLGDGWRTEFGLFRSIRDEHTNFVDLALGVDRQGAVAQERILADRDQYSASTSGEFRVIKGFATGGLAHRLTVMVRGRDQVRRYGGQASFPLGPTSLITRVAVPAPHLTFGPQDRADVNQLSYGLAYELTNGKGLRLNLAVQHSDYRKEVDFANPARANTRLNDRPWLFSANAVVPLADGLSLYGGIVRGLEESPNAPDIAVNASEAPPAARTRQIDGGVRWAIAPRVTLIGGLFQIDKPYYNLDAARTYGILGDVRYRGAELSLTGTLAPGLTVVAGTLLLDPRISGREVDSGRIGPRPVGSIRRRSVANLDWRPGGTSPWSFDLAVESLSGAMANATNTYTAPARATVGVGSRYRFELAGAKWLARVQVINLTNAYGWKVSSSGGYTFNQQRTVTGTLAVDL